MEEIINLMQEIEKFQYRVFIGVTDLLILAVITLLIMAAITIWQTWE